MESPTPPFVHVAEFCTVMPRFDAAPLITMPEDDVVHADDDVINRFTVSSDIA